MSRSGPRAKKGRAFQGKDRADAKLLKERRLLFMSIWGKLTHMDRGKVVQNPVSQTENARFFLSAIEHWKVLRSTGKKSVFIPIAVLINYCKVSSLKQQTFFFFKSYSFLDQNHNIGLTSLKSTLVGLFSFLEAVEKNAFPWLSNLETTILWLMFNASNSSWISSHISSPWLPHLPSSSTFKDVCDYNSHTQIMYCNLPI